MPPADLRLKPVRPQPLKRKVQTILDIVGVVFILDVIGSILTLVVPHRINDNTVEAMIGISIIIVLVSAAGGGAYALRAKGRLSGSSPLVEDFARGRDTSLQHVPPAEWRNRQTHRT